MDIEQRIERLEDAFVAFVMVYRASNPSILSIPIANATHPTKVQQLVQEVARERAESKGQ